VIRGVPSQEAEVDTLKCRKVLIFSVNFHVSGYIKIAWETVREHVKLSAKEML
jgi:hypothetical protein